MNVERRTSRSENVYEALHLQLAASLKRANFNSIILSEDQGFPVAGAGDANEGEEIAALAPSLVPGNSLWQGTVSLDGGPKKQVTIAPLETDGGKLYLCGVGGDAYKTVPAMLYSCLGVNRIFV